MKGATVRSLEPRPGREPAPTPVEKAPSAPRLARGVVTAVQGATVTVALAGHAGHVGGDRQAPGGVEVSAEMAMALPYAACEGDVLLVLGDGAEHFVVGVLAGRGKTSLQLQGDVSLRAVGGVLELEGDEGVCVRGPAVEVHADKLHTVARSVVQTFSTLFQRVTEALHVHARQEVSLVDEGSYKQAKTVSIQTEETVTINGKEIHLG